MLHACVRRFDVMVTVQNFLELNRALMTKVWTDTSLYCYCWGSPPSRRWDHPKVCRRSTKVTKRRRARRDPAPKMMPWPSGCLGHREGPPKISENDEGRHWRTPRTTESEGSGDRSESCAQRSWQEPSGMDYNLKVANHEGNSIRSLSKATTEGTRRARNTWSE